MLRQYMRAFAMGKRQWPKMVLSFIGMLIDSVTVLAVPLLLRRAVDLMAAGGPGVKAGLAEVAWLSLGLGLVRAGGIYLEIYMQESLGNRIGTDVRSALWQKLLRLPFPFYDRTMTGDVISRLTKDVDAIRDGTGFVALITVVNTIMVVGTVIAMFVLDAGLALAVLALAPVMLSATVLYTKAISPVYREIEARSGTLHTVAQENVSGIRVVKAFTRSREETVKFDRENKALHHANREVARLNALINPAMDFFGTLLTLVVLGYGGYKVALGRLDLGVMLAFTGYMQFIYWPLRQTGWLADLISKALAGAERIFELLDQKEEAVGGGGGIGGDVRGRLVFEDVCFRYEEGDECSLAGFNLAVAPGERVAIIGRTGSGKTTVANLIPRFYDPTAGRVLLDGRDLRDWPLDELRQQIGFVFQDNFLFSLSILDNIRLGRKDAGEEAVGAAAADAQIARTVEALPEKYRTVVGERGVGLSGGERQRLALARALLGDPPILVLDDSTASLDARTENAVREALDRRAAGKTVIIVAQRVATAMYADRILVLEDGRVVEEGSHQELLALNKIYAALYREQMSLLAAE